MASIRATATKSAFPETQAGGRTAGEIFGMDPPSNTRGRLIAAALDLFYTYGFHAVGLDQVLRTVGISKQAFYHHFESKDALTIEVVQQQHKHEIAAFFDAVQQRTREPRAMLTALFDVMDAWFNQPKYEGCLFLNACVEFPSASDPVHQAAAGHYVDAEAALRDTAEAAGAEDPAALAKRLVLLIEGAFVYRLIANDHSAARHARALAELAVAEACD
jgi:AcrR family transcriptional regulator